MNDSSHKMLAPRSHLATGLVVGRSGVSISKSVIVHSLSYLAFGKAVSLDGSPARLILGATTKLNLNSGTNTYLKRTEL